MVLDVAISVGFLLLLALVIINGKYARAGVLHRPLMYNSLAVQTLLNLCLLAFIGLSIYLLLFYSWRFFLILSLVGFMTEAWIFVPVVEKTLGRVYVWLLGRVSEE